MLSGDLATLLTGRYVEISMLPLFFQEYMEHGGQDREHVFAGYIKYDGLPFVASMEKINNKVDDYLEGINNTVIVRNIEDRDQRKDANPEKRKINDITLLKSIAKYLASVIGSPISIRGITNYLVSSGRKISPNTVNDYVEALTELFVFYPTERFDIVGK